MKKILYFLFTPIIIFSCGGEQNVIINHGNLLFEINGTMQTRVTSKATGVAAYMRDFQSSDYLVIDGEKVDAFRVEEVDWHDFDDGKGSRWTITGKYLKGNLDISKSSSYSISNAFTNAISIKSSYKVNAGAGTIDKMVSNHYVIAHNGDKPRYWAFQGSSTSARSDWIRPLEPGYYDRNYMGMNNSDYGGGIPVVDIWRRDGGIAIGHLEMAPKLISLPTEIKHNGEEVNVSIEKWMDYPTTFGPGDNFETLETFVLVHSGDYYNALSQYSMILSGCP